MNAVAPFPACQWLIYKHAAPCPDWTLDHHRNAHGRPEVPARCTARFPAEAAVRLSALRRDGTFRTTLSLPEYGRFHMLVRHRPSDLEIHVDCDATPAYDWLSSQRSQLERRLTHAFARPARVDVTLGGHP